MVQLVIPTRGNPCYETVQAAEQLCRGGLPPVYIQGNLSAADTKSRAVFWFLRYSKADYYLQLDDDVVPLKDFLALADHGLEIVSGVYPLFNQVFGMMPYDGVFREVSNGHVPWGEAHGLTEVDAVGGGAICIHRSVLEKVRPAFVDLTDDWGRIMVSEDLNFCRRARQAGFKIWADFDVRCEHLKRMGISSMIERVRISTIMAQAFEDKKAEVVHGD